MPCFVQRGTTAYYFDAEKKGYAGTALYSREKPSKIVRGTGFPIADTEGRYIQADYSGLSVVSLYLPSDLQAQSGRSARSLYGTLHGVYARTT
jgi:exodeoxyribonuclease-3